MTILLYCKVNLDTTALALLHVSFDNIMSTIPRFPVQFLFQGIKSTTPTRPYPSSDSSITHIMYNSISFQITQHSIPYMALSTSLLTWYQSALRSANSYTSSARNTPPKRSPSAMMVAISLECRGSMR